MFKNTIFSCKEATRINESSILSIATPPATESYIPYSHRNVKEATDSALRELGFLVKDRFYSASRDGAQVVSLWVLNAERGNGYACAVWRNSLNKLWAVGYCEAVIHRFTRQVLSFGRFSHIRRHSGKLTEDGLHHLIKNEVKTSLSRIDSLLNWHKGLKDYTFDKPTAERLMTLAMRKRALLPRNFDKFDSQFFKLPVLSLYSFHDVLTHLIRDDHLQRMMEYNVNITRFTNSAKQIISKHT